MEHLKALAIKTIASLVMIYIILGLFFGYSFGNVLALTLILGVVSYILGDLLLLPRTNNLVSTISDFAVAMLITWFYLANITYNPDNVFLASLLTSIGLALFEWFFHKYMKTNVLKDTDNGERINNLQYQTESSEELVPDRTTFNESNEGEYKGRK